LTINKNRTEMHGQQNINFWLLLLGTAAGKCT